MSPTRLFLLLALFFVPSMAHAQGAKESFIQLNSCLTSGAPAHCRSMLTKNSLELYDRISSYDVMSCLPKTTEYVAEQPLGAYSMVQASTKLGDTTRYLKMAFIKEQGKWKLDIPYSLRVAMGENWEKQLKMTEQIYLILRAQLQGKLDCKTVQNLAVGQNAIRKNKQPN